MLADCAGSGGFCTVYYQSDFDGGISVADGVSALRWFFDLSPEQASRIREYVTDENQNDMALLYDSLPTWEKVALVAKDTGDALGAGGLVSRSKTSVAAVVGKNPVKTPTKGGTGAKFADQAKFQDHFVRHGGDFGATSPKEYEAQADVFLTSPKTSGILEKVRANGDVVRFNQKTNEFGVVSGSGVIRTYYKPDPAAHGKGTNLDYFNAQ